MKKIFRYLVLFLALTGIVTACDILNPVIEPADIGLGIKVFFPTKVVKGQPMTINGSGFKDVTEIEFPDGVRVTDFEIVSNDMIRVNAPAGISAEGGKIIVRTADEQVESPLPLTVGKTVVAGFSKEPGEEIQGGEQITVYGTDLEFINGAEFLDADGNPVILSDAAFYRKGTSSVVITIPKKVFEGTFTGKLFTYDGQEILLPELKYKPASEGGHWETQKTVIWTNDTDKGVVDWGNVNYRFAGEGFETGEEVAIIPAETWEKMKTTPFYMSYTGGESYQIRVTTGWWSVQWLGSENDIAPWNMADRIIDNGDGTFAIKVDFSEDPAILDVIDEQHLLFTGAGYTPVAIYFSEDVWIEGEGHMEIVKTSIWKNDTDKGVVDWGNVNYRIAGAGFETGEEVAIIPAETWEKMKTTPFYMSYTGGESYQIRVTTGWWSVQWLGSENDIAPWNMADRIIDNGDGTFAIKVDFSEDSAILDVIDEQHLLFTGAGYTPVEIYFAEEVWIGGGGEPKEVLIWTNDTDKGVVDWGNVNYRLAGAGFETGEEVAIIPAETWEKMKTTPFYMSYTGGESYQIRVTTGWWSVQWLGSENDIAPWNMADRIIDNGDGTFAIKVDFSEDSAILDVIDEQHLLFTGAGYTPKKLYFLE